MRFRTLGLAAAVLLAAPLMSSCRNPRPPGGTTTTTVTGGGSALPLKDCGVIDRSTPMSAAEQQTLDCWQGAVGDPTGGYHFGHLTYHYKITVIDNGTTTVYETLTRAHQIQITTTAANGAATTRQCGSNQFTDSQFIFDRTTGGLATDVC
jgi:hypothetical protein